MQWEISSGKATYTCGACDWKLEVPLREISEPGRLFDRHVCMNIENSVE